ncbi:MAG: MotA/TolQ/ExbB proton channel family protein [Candidatus Eisenbacteria sp.]|nr:MotA/TolQ/ExbB proton channel family protein [Candidatus Eisenbacteria bacterium]
MGTVGHLVLIILLLMSVYATGIMFDRWLLLRKAHRQSLEFVRVARRLLAEGKLTDLVEEAAKHPQSHLARIYSAAILDTTPWRSSGPPGEGFEDTIRSATEREGARITQEFKRGLSGLASIGSTAPFVGLFGTVIGIMNSFFGMAATGSGGIGAVSGGIAEALVNTAAGILVALPAVWGFNYFLGRLERIHSEMSNASSELVDYFIKKSRSDSWKLEATTGRPVNR